EELGIETIGLRASMFARYRNARRVDHIGLDLTGAQPARQLEAVAASLIGHSDPLDDLAGLIGFLLPTMQKLQQSMLIGRELWRSIPGTIPATSQLDWPISITAINVASCSRATRDRLKSFSCRGMGALHRSIGATMVRLPRRSPHSI